MVNGYKLCKWRKGPEEQEEGQEKGDEEEKEALITFWWESIDVKSNTRTSHNTYYNTIYYNRHYNTKAMWLCTKMFTHWKLTMKSLWVEFEKLKWFRAFANGRTEKTKRVDMSVTLSQKGFHFVFERLQIILIWHLANLFNFCRTCWLYKCWQRLERSKKESVLHIRTHMQLLLQYLH